MGLLDDAEKIAGVVTAVEGVRNADPNASIVAQGEAAITAFEGAGGTAEKKEDDGGQQG